MVNPNPTLNGILLFKQRKARTKANRLIGNRRKWREEKMLTEEEIDKYIEQLKKDQPNDSKVAAILLKWLELKKKYQIPDANTVFELDMEKLMNYALITTKSEQISPQKAICQTTKK